MSKSANWDACCLGCPGWALEDGNVVRCEDCDRFGSDQAAAEHVETLAEGERQTLTRIEVQRIAHEWLKRAHQAHCSRDESHALERCAMKICAAAGVPLPKWEI